MAARNLPCVGRVARATLTLLLGVALAGALLRGGAPAAIAHRELFGVPIAHHRADRSSVPRFAQPSYVPVSSLRPDVYAERRQSIGEQPPALPDTRHNASAPSPALFAAALAVGFFALAPARREAFLAVQGRMSRRTALAAVGAALLAPRAADAAYGPSGAVIRSEPPVKDLALEDFLGLNQKKRQQRTDAFTSDQLRGILSEIEGSRQSILNEIKRNEDQRNETKGLIDQARDAVTNALESANMIEGKDARRKGQVKQVKDAMEAKKAKEAKDAKDAKEQKDRIALLEQKEAELKKKQAELTELFNKFTSDNTFQSELKAREQKLAALDNQAAYISWGAAALAAVISTLVMHPIDTIKTLKISQSSQSDSRTPQDDEALELTWSPATLPKLYKGVVGNIVKEGPSSAFYLGVYELVRARLSAVPFMAPNPIAIYLISGGVGEVFASILRAPAEAVKSTVQSGQTASALEGAQLLFSDPERRSNVFRAWSASLWRDVPMGAIQIALFEGIKVYIIESPTITVDVDSLIGEAALGAFGGALAAFLTTPPDVLTTLIITQPEGSSEGVGQMLGRVLEEEGAGGLFTGAFERVVYWGPAIGIFLSSYCSLRQQAINLGL